MRERSAKIAIKVKRKSNGFSDPAMPASIAPPQPRLLDGRQLAHILGVKPRTILELAKRKEIPSIRVGDLHRFQYDEVLSALKNKKS